jgi:hypothetical protein
MGSRPRDHGGHYVNALYGYSNGQYYPPVPTTHQGPSYQPLPNVTTNTTLVADVPIPIITASGYALMTQMAQKAIAILGGAKLKSGYLQDIGFGMGDCRGQAIVGVSAWASPTCPCALR